MRPSQQDISLYKKGLSGCDIRHERFKNSSSVMTGLPRSLRRYTVKVTQEAGVVPHHIYVAIGTCLLLVASYDMQEKRLAYSTSAHRAIAWEFQSFSTYAGHSLSSDMLRKYPRLSLTWVPLVELTYNSIFPTNSVHLVFPANSVHSVFPTKSVYLVFSTDSEYSQIIMWYFD